MQSNASIESRSSKLSIIESALERQITLHQLRVFKAVVDAASFTRAAEALVLSQPAVTHQVQALAKALGQALFASGRGKLELTPVGKAVHEGAGRILALVRETAETIDDLVGLRRGTVHVAADTTVGIYVAPDALAGFRPKHPQIKLSLDVVNKTQVRALLLAGEADLGLVGRVWDEEQFASEPLMENQLMCFCAPGHPLLAREPLRAADLLEGPLLLREPGSATREATEAILREHGVDPEADMEMASNGALKRAVAGGLGVAVFSTWAVRLELAAGLLHPLRVEGFPAKRMWHVVWVRQRLLSPAAQAFRAHLQGMDWRSHLPIPLGSD